MTPCATCGHAFDPTRKGTAHRITGWVVDRTEQGLKANAVREKQFTGEVRCPDCQRSAELGILPGQESLL